MAADETTSLEHLIAACARGEKPALHAIYRAEAGRMIAVAQRILKRRALAEDAVQDAFVLIWRNAAKFDPAKGSGATWIFTILRNRSLSILRDESRVEATDAPVGEEVPDEGESPEAAIARLSDSQALRNCLDKLEPKRRMAIALAYVHGLSHGELAGKLGIPLGTIKSWMRRSLMSLKECLQ
jgi:RNA polymerase sigma-70 factor (ECF subfamily)